MADYLSVYGAAIGSAAAIGAVWNTYLSIFHDKARIRIKLGKEFYTDDDAAFAMVSYTTSNWDSIAQDFPQGELKAHLQVINQGRRPVTIVEAGLEFESNTRAVFKPGTTGELSEGKALSFVVSEAGLGQIILRNGIPSRLYAIDASHKFHRERVDQAILPWLEDMCGQKKA
jgi:hypothetical protein